MSNYLSILAQRAVAAPSLRPRARSRFEEGLAAEAVSREPAFPAGQHAETEESARRGSAAADVQPQPQSQPQDMRASTLLSLQPDAGASLPAPRPAFTATVAQLSPQREPVPVLHVETPPLVAPTAHIERVLPMAAAAPAALAPVAAAGAEGARGSEVASRLPQLSSLAPSPARSSPEPDDAARPQRPALETVSRLQTPVVAAMAQQAGGDTGQGAARQFAAPPEAAAPIEIHIGRIEVHAAGAAPVRTPPPQAAQAPATASLDDYLRERNRGGRP